MATEIKVIELQYRTGRVYVVVEQWPHREVAEFASLDEANAFIKGKADILNLPLIVSREVN